MMNGEQITVQFHVDNLNVSHKDHPVLEDFCSNLRTEFGKEVELTENKELVHKYLGIIIDYSILCKVVFTMFDYLKDIIVKANKDLKIVIDIILEMTNCSRLITTHQVYHRRIENYFIVIL